MSNNRRAILVGTGGMGKAWGRNLLSLPDQIDVVGLVDVLAGAAAAAADELGIKAEYAGSDLGKALAELKPDFIVDVTIPEAHHDVTLQSLAAGVPVIGEKPMASSMQEARAMVQASEKSGKLYMVSQSRRYDDNSRALRNLVNDNLGEVGLVNTDFYIGAHFGGFRDAMRSPLILDMAIHTFDSARYVSGLDPIAVYCDEFNPSWSWYKGDACATAIFEMGNGARYTYRGSWCAEGAPTSWEAEWRIAGERGTAIWSGKGNEAPYADIIVGEDGFQRNTERKTARVETAPTGIAGSIRDFLHALDTGRAPMGECHDNIKSLAMVFAAMESSDSKQRVPIHY